MDTIRFVRGLTKGLSQTTSNLLSIRLGVNNPTATDAYSVSDWPDFSNHFHNDWYWMYSESNFSDSDSNLGFVNDKHCCNWEINSTNNSYNSDYYNDCYVQKPHVQNMDYKSINHVYW